jgi:lincosamide nucleotidyltransferase A/C/D/E
VNAFPAGGLARTAAQRVRQWALGRMRADDVLVVLAVLAAEGVACVLAGGWAVDALDGEERRRHADVDIVIDDYETALPLARQALGALGFREVEQRDIPGLWMPRLSLLDDGAGHRVELVSIDWPLLCGAIGADDTTVRQRAITTGKIQDQTVACLSAPVQLLFHSGFPPRSTDESDVAQLLRQVAAALPFCGDDGRARRAATTVLLANHRVVHDSPTDIARHDIASSLPSWLGEVGG